MVKVEVDGGKKKRRKEKWRTTIKMAAWSCNVDLKGTIVREKEKRNWGEKKQQQKSLAGAGKGAPGQKTWGATEKCGLQKEVATRSRGAPLGHREKGKKSHTALKHCHSTLSCPVEQKKLDGVAGNKHSMEKKKGGREIPT